MSMHMSTRIKTLAILVCILFCLASSASVVYATHGAGNCCNGGQAGEHTGGCGIAGGCVAPAPAPVPQYYACTLSFNKTVIQAGSPALTVSWSPAGGVGTLARAGASIAAIAAGQASFVDTSIASLAPGTYTYTVSHQTGVVHYDCSKVLTVVSMLTECNDQVDNSDTEDALIDSADPGCHTDGDSSNTSSYSGTIPSETNTPANLVASIQKSGLMAPGSRMYVHGVVKNDSPVNTGNLSDRIIAWRKVGAACAVNCVVHNGALYEKIYSGAGFYAPRWTWTTDTSFVPATAGSYEVCMLSDTQNTVFESSESDNAACISFAVTAPVVTAPLSVDVSLRTQNPAGPWLHALSILPKQKINLQWQPSAGAVSCVSLAPTLFTIPAATSKVGGTVLAVTEPTSGSQTYTVECTDASGNKATGSAVATIRGTITGPMTLSAQPTRVRKGSSTKVVWNTGGRTSCSIKGTNNESIAASALLGSQTTSAITAPTTFTLSCLDDGSEVSAVVNLLPTYQEI